VPGWRTVSLFSGCGGMDLGFVAERFDIVWANDENKWACETYRENLGDHITCGSISKLDLHDLPDCDVIIGGPPCQGFSPRGKMDPDDPRSGHIWTFARAVLTKRPRFFVMENVPALVNFAKFRKAFKELVATYEQAGYKVCYQVLNADAFDVPQSRQRVFLLGTDRRDIDPCEAFPTPREARLSKTVRDVIGDLPAPGEPGNEGVSGSLIIPVKPSGVELRKTPYGGNNLFNGAGRALDLDIPGKSILADISGNGAPIVEQNLLDDPNAESWIQKYHAHLMAGGRPWKKSPPKYVRRITVSEAARLQGFPDWFVFEGPQSAQLKQIGNAVPPPFARHIARAVAAALAGRPLYEPIPVGPMSRTVAGRIAAGEIVTERDADQPEYKHVWIDGRPMGSVIEQDGQWYSVRGSDISEPQDTEIDACKVLAMLDLRSRLGAPRHYIANPAPGPVAKTLRELGFRKGDTWRIAHSGYELEIADLDGGLPRDWNESVLITYWDAGEPIEDFETTLGTVRVGLERWRDDDAGVDEIMQYVAVADRVWARNPAVTPKELAEWLASPENFMVEAGFDPDLVWQYTEDPESVIQDLIGVESDYPNKMDYQLQRFAWQTEFERGAKLWNRMEAAEAER
jgi:DNA (cytosine-5)-methyltransferase 1